jgi:hypothetical protein
MFIACVYKRFDPRTSYLALIAELDLARSGLFHPTLRFVEEPEAPFMPWDFHGELPLGLANTA